MLLLLAALATPLAHAQNIGSALSATEAAMALSTTVPMYTDFDLFKNTGFTSCLINSNATADPTTKDFLVTRNVATQQQFCSYMAGTPILIPTQATSTAFFPWYPTLLLQALSLAGSYAGLHFSLRFVDRSRTQASRGSAPWYYWAQLPVDAARAAAYLVTAVHGYLDPLHFAWASVLFWLLPLNHMVLAERLREQRDADIDEPYAGASLQFSQLRAMQLQKEERLKKEQQQQTQQPARQSRASRHLSHQRRSRRERGSSLEIFNSGNSTLISSSGDRSSRRGEIKSQALSSPGWARRSERLSGGWPSLSVNLSAYGPHALGPGPARRGRGAAAWAWTVAAGLCWLQALVHVVLHWKWRYSPGTSFARPYMPSSAALTDPASVGDMPLRCLEFLAGGALANATSAGGASFFALDADMAAQGTVATLQFLVACAVPPLIWWSARRLRLTDFDRARRLLSASALVTLLMLLVPAIALGADIAAKAAAGQPSVSLRFTNDLEATGGCTFAFLNMNKRAGYFDVAAGRAGRVVLALLGVA
jgi:hypothetical protein